MTTTGAAPWTSAQVRADIERLLVRDLLGPWAGDDEELQPGAVPSERYILGLLAPAGTPLDAALTDATARDDGTGEGAGEVTAAAAAGSMTPASMGLSFSVPADVESVLVKASWGRYEPGPSDHHKTEAGTPRVVWKRAGAGGEVVVDVQKPDASYEPDPHQPGVQLRTRSRAHGDVRVVDIAIVNAQPEPKERRDTAKLFQVRLDVTAADGTSAVFLPHAGPSPRADDELAGLAMLYRDAIQFAVGRNAAVEAARHAGADRAWRVSTTNVPSHDVPQTVAPSVEEVPQLAGLELDMRVLAELPREQVVAALRPLADGYRSWLAEQARLVDTDAGLAPYARIARDNLRNAAEAADRIGAGIDLLADETDDRAWQAWRFANLAMAMQREHTEVAVLRAREPDVSYADALRRVSTSDRRSWRPFQLAFVLLNLPSLTDPAHPDRRQAGDGGRADLLFFPTGGGKTEAYLGLTAYAFAIRRLQGVVGEGPDARDGRAGVAVLMRYTLRLLTAQQFQRAATLVCATERLRREAADAAADGGPPNPWGDEPFRIGLWVGSKVAPNWYDDARKALDDMHHRYAGAGRDNPVQLLACPWCGRPLAAGQDAEPDDDRRRVLVWCGDPDGDCEFSRKQSQRWHEGLPVVTVDEEVFRLAPALVIGTVDKFAQLPLRGQTGLLFGRATSWCERHGLRHPDMADKTGCREGGHPRRNDLPGTHPRPCGPLRPPDLVIQDELHLISGALGTLVGLYETAVDRLASWTVGGVSVRPKVVASTATVRRAAEQVHGVFNRDLRIFPPPVLDAGATFFSTQVPVGDGHPGRRYVGVCAHGQRLKQVQIRVAQLLLAAGQYEFDLHGAAADPYMTLVDYFSSTTELAGMRRLVDDDITTRLQRMARRGLRDRKPIVVRELTSRIQSQDVAAALAALANEFDPDVDSTAARDARAQLFRVARSRTPEAKKAMRELEKPQRDPSKHPVDVLLATSMLQVGVDVARLGLMMVTGQPKNSAEYIQATSRVGRDAKRPGLVVTLYNWARPRDLAHFETFGHFHETFYARVEALSVTPFAERALDRGLAAVLVAALRHTRPDWEHETGAHAVPVSDADVDAAVEWIAERGGDVLGEALAVERVRQACRALLDEWDRARRGLETGVLSYTRDSANVTPLLHTSGAWGRWSVGWSLREVEPEVNLLIDLDAPEVADRPGWGWPPPAAGGDDPTAAPAADDSGLTGDEGGADEVGLVDDGAVVSPAAGEPAR